MTRLTIDRSVWAIRIIIEASSVAAARHRDLLSSTTSSRSSDFSALNMAAWWRQITADCKVMLRYMEVGSDDAAGSRRWAGRWSDMLSSVLLIFLCVLQNSLLATASSFALLGRWRCSIICPVRLATITHPPNDDIEAACAGSMASRSEISGPEMLELKSSSENGRNVNTCELCQHPRAMFQLKTYIALVHNEWPSSPNASTSVHDECHPKCSSPFILLTYISGRGQCLLHIKSKFI